MTSVHPGRVATEMQHGLVAYEGGEYQPERFLSPETVAKVVADAVNAPPDAHIHEVIVRPTVISARSCRDGYTRSLGSGRERPMNSIARDRRAVLRCLRDR